MQRLREIAAMWGIDLTPTQLAAFQTYYEQLVRWNQQVNLTTVTDIEEVQIRHFADSLALLPILESGPFGPHLALVDIGSGAGFPGLPLKIVRPAWRVVLVDATRKKTEFLQHLIQELRLQDVEVVWARAEEVGQNPAYREQFDIATARAVAELAVLAEYALPLVRVGGWFVAQKGPDPAQECAAARAALAQLGGREREIRPYHLPSIEQPFHLVIIEKVALTPARYPRRPGIPARRPIGRPPKKKGANSP